jgi:hypothetical protein
MGRRILNRKDLRADYDAAERRKQDDDEVEEEEEKDEDEEDEERAEGDEEEGEAAEEEEEEAPPVVAKKKKAPPKTTKAKPRSRAAKVTRMKIVWGVFNNSNARVATFDYPKRKDADDLAAKLTTDKKQTHFVQPVKEPFEEKAKE